MTANTSWQYQGRQQHGWFGAGTGPGSTATSPKGPDSQPGGLFDPGNIGGRADYAARSVIFHIGRANRNAPAAQFDNAARLKLRNAVIASYAATDLNRDAFRKAFFNPYTSDSTVDQWRGVVKSIVEATTPEELAQAGENLTKTIEDVGLWTWPRTLGDMNRQAIAAVDDGKLPGAIRVGTGDTAATATLMLGAALIGGLASIFGAGKPSPGKPETPPFESPEPLIPTTVTADRPSYVDVPPYVEGETPSDILKPGGQLVGEEGSSAQIRVVHGGAPAAEALFDRLRIGGTTTTPHAQGARVLLSNGDTIGYRPQSTSGPPTIDVKVAGVGIRKIKFPEPAK